MKNFYHLGFFLIAACLHLPTALLAQPVAVGGELQVNTYNTGFQYDSDVAMDAFGHFVVVWQSDGSSGSDTDGLAVLGQRHASDGSPVAAEFQVNSVTADDQNYPAVVSTSDGTFVVVWESDNEYGDDGTDVRAQRYASDGSALGGQIAVNSYTTGSQKSAAVSIQDTGEFVVTWQSLGSTGDDDSSGSVQAQRFGSDGDPVGQSFQVNTYTTNDQIYPAIAQRPDGGFVIVWQSNGSNGGDTDSLSIQGQRYDSTGAALGTEFQVNSYTTGFQRNPALTVDDDGAFVVVWTSFGSPGSDNDDRSILARRFASDGTAIGGDFQVTTCT